MFGLIAYHSGNTQPVVFIDGVRFRSVRVAEGTTLRAKLAARSAAQALLRSGVRFAVFPPDYPLVPVFTRRGIVPPPLAPLYRAAAPAVIRRCMAQRGIDPRAAAVAFAAKHVTPELCRCAAALCGEIRYVILCVPGCESLSHTLSRDFGVAARIVAPGAATHSDLTVVFDDASAPGDALRLDDALGVAFDSPHANEMLALLHRAGALDAAALRVTALAPVI